VSEETIRSRVPSDAWVPVKDLTAQPDVWVQPRVTFRKHVSDGNYGSETAEVSVDVDGLGSLAAISQRLADARELVHAELARSPSWRVRDAVKPELPVGVASDEDPEDLQY